MCLGNEGSESQSATTSIQRRYVYHLSETADRRGELTQDQESSMSGYSLCILTYNRGAQWDDPSKAKPFHWSFFLQTGSTPDIGLEFQLRGLPGAFYYAGEESVDVALREDGNGRLEIGFVPVGMYGLFKRLLGEVPIDLVESSGWNCQSWCLAALDRLRGEGLVGRIIRTRLSATGFERTSDRPALD